MYLYMYSTLYRFTEAEDHIGGSGNFQKFSDLRVEPVQPLQPH